MKYKQGDIVFLPFPFTDLSSAKQRPAVIISQNGLNYPNYIVAKITSVIRADRCSFAIQPDDTDVPLKYESEVRTNDLVTIHHSLIMRKIASFKKDALIQLTEAIQKNLEVK